MLHMASYMAKAADLPASAEKSAVVLAGIHRLAGVFWSSHALPLKGVARSFGRFF
jgi:hypothetical protein